MGFSWGELYRSFETWIAREFHLRYFYQRPCMGIVRWGMIGCCYRKGGRVWIGYLHILGIYLLLNCAAYVGEKEIRGERCGL